MSGGREGDEYAVARERMVARLRAQALAGEEVLAAMAELPRHLFVDAALAGRAYGRDALPIGYGQTLSHPEVVARMTEALLPEAGLRALEVGTGSGYQAALLAALGLEVWTVERIAGLLARAEPLWERLGVAGRIHARHADGYRGWPEAAPFARVIITAAPRELPRALFGQLGDGGLLVTPLGGEADQRLLRFRLRGERAFREDLGACSFVPMLGRTVGTA
ncbi:protein-L-isoaspartate(D-aspartate) O-methyltransferase [bacterium]|nr:protein-L-isoaspartate(D-aspartate) O-methyltransferase [bacterium]